MNEVSLVVSGSKCYTGLPIVVSVLDIICNNSGNIKYNLIEGGARGVDSLAREYAVIRGLKCKTEKADWSNLDVYPCVIKRYGNGTEYNALAGFIRNELMIKKDIVKIVVMFSLNNSPGTMDAKKHAKQYKKNYLYMNVNNSTIELGVQGEVHNILSYDEFIKGGFKDWLQLVIENIENE